MRRAAILALCAILLALSWWRSALPSQNHDGAVRFTALDVSAMPPAPGSQFAVAGAWVLASNGDDFGGYSALEVLPTGHFLALSDRGRLLIFSDPSLGAPLARMGWFLAADTQDKRAVDIEDSTLDPARGMLWVSYEQRNAIVRVGADRTGPHTVRPLAMRDWPENRGPEAMTRLADGRFIVLSESGHGWFDTSGPALLFPGDPVEGAVPVSFSFRALRFFRPTAMAALPDGRVLILVRRLLWPVPARFSARLLIADPRDIRPGQVWEGREVARFAAPVPVDNYEGLAVRREPGGHISVWIISDDNNALSQRTILLKLDWRDASRKKGAEGNPAP